MARVYPMGLLFAGLLLLMLPGMLYNNLDNSGLAPAFALTCSNDPGDYTCQNSNSVGCQLAPSYCTLNGTSISFLNSKSPFTSLLSGNIFALFSPLTSNGNVNRGPFDPNGGGQYYTADCYVQSVSAGAAQNITQNSFSALINKCTQTNSDNSNTTQANAFTFGDWNYNQLGASEVDIPFYQIYNNATWALTCYNQGWWFVTNQGNVGYSYAGCDYYEPASYSPPAAPNTTAIYSFLVAIPCQYGNATCKAGNFPTGDNHMEIFVQPENWDTQYCTNAFTIASQDQANWYGSQQCTNFESWFNVPHASGGLQAGFFTPFLTILIGLILFLMGTGVNIRAGGSIFGSGTDFGAGVNRQGTKMAQILGTGLILYTFLYSEFSTWFTSGIFPNGLDGSLGIIAIVIDALIWGGLIWQATQD